MTHTPGPWKTVLFDNDDRNDIGIVAGGIIAEAFYRIDDDTYVDVEANARLIAAAPELFEELEQIVIGWENIENGMVSGRSRLTPWEEESLKFARQAIAQAEGE